MPKNIIQTRYGADYFIDEYPAMSKERLMDRILQDVKDSQLLAGRHLPDKMYLRKDQFQLLEDDMELMEHTKDRMFITPMNVMEVHVV